MHVIFVGWVEWGQMTEVWYVPSVFCSQLVNLGECSLSKTASPTLGKTDTSKI